MTTPPAPRTPADGWVDAAPFLTQIRVAARMDRMDVPLPVVEDDVRLQSLLAAPPLGHRKELQPDTWYEQVFDLLACTHPETCPCPPEETL